MVLYRTLALLLTAWQSVYCSYPLVLRCVQHEGADWFAVDWRHEPPPAYRCWVSPDF